MSTLGIALLAVLVIPSALLVAAMFFLEWRDRREDRRVARELDRWLRRVR